MRVKLTAVCDRREDLLEWFAQVPTVQLRTKDHAKPANWKRLALGQTNSWHFEAIGTEGGGELDTRFICATPEEAVQSHELWQAALKSHAENAVVEL